jgi:ribonuclease HI
MIAYYRQNSQVRLFTDAACKTGFGFVLEQLSENNTWRPIAIGRRAVTDAESRYAPIESEITALTWSLRKARKFLIGDRKFKVYTDHRPLVSLVNGKRYNDKSPIR